jgi:hypothetical protein
MTTKSKSEFPQAIFLDVEEDTFPEITLINKTGKDLQATVNYDDENNLVEIVVRNADTE